MGAIIQFTEPGNKVNNKVWDYKRNCEYEQLGSYFL